MPLYLRKLWVSLEMWLRDRHMLAYYLADFNYVQEYFFTPQDRRRTGKIILAWLATGAVIFTVGFLILYAQL